MQIKINSLETENPIAAWVHDRIYNRNSNCVIMVNGSPGTGKTYSGLSLADGLGIKFSTAFICGSIESLYNMVLKITKEPEKYKGAVVVYEESNVEQNKMRSMSTEATSYTTLLSSFRSLNTILIATAPYGSHLQKQALDYIDIGMVTEHIDHHKQICVLSVKFYERSEETSKTYKKFLTVITPEGTYKLAKIGVKLPSRELIRHYEDMKLDFQRAYYQKELKKLESKRKGKRRSYPHICPHCKHTWRGHVRNPQHCPNCKRRIPKSKAK